MWDTCTKRVHITRDVKWSGRMYVKILIPGAPKKGLLGMKSSYPKNPGSCQKELREI
jgi:hypothetical protein